MTRIRILTNHPGQEVSPTWNAVTTYLPSQRNSIFSSLRLGAKLYIRQRNYDCIVLGAGRSDIVFALMQALLPFKKTPCIMIDCLWYKNPNKFYHFIKIIMMKFMDKAVDKYAVWASREVDAYSKTFKLPRRKFIFVPYHTTIDGYNILPKDGDYIFSGGNFARDYETLIEVIRGLPVKLIIASTRPELFENISLPANVDVRGYSHEGYLKKMAGCLINIVALAPGLLHSGGQQTFLNSMRLGKPTIVTDPEGASDYIENGKDGLLVKPGDPETLRRAIKKILDDPVKAREIGRIAMFKAMSYSTEEHFKKIVSITEELVAEKSV